MTGRERWCLGPGPAFASLAVGIALTVVRVRGWLDRRRWMAR